MRYLSAFFQKNAAPEGQEPAAPGYYAIFEKRAPTTPSGKETVHLSEAQCRQAWEQASASTEEPPAESQAYKKALDAIDDLRTIRAEAAWAAPLVLSGRDLRLTV